MNTSSTVKPSPREGQYETSVEHKRHIKQFGVDNVNRGCHSDYDAATCEIASFLDDKARRHQKKEETRADFIDKISRGLFPFVFVIFNLVYWCYYLLAN